MKKVLGAVALIAVLFAVLACKKKEAAVQEDYVFKIGYAANNLCHAPLYYFRQENGNYL